MNLDEQDHDNKKNNLLLLTIFLKHDQSQTIESIRNHLAQTGFWQEFPPQGVEVASWYVVMGIGQLVTLRLPADKLREVNQSIEARAWGAFRTEFYATYDFVPVWQSKRSEAMKKHSD
jgi:hypothetical protein